MIAVGNLISNASETKIADKISQRKRSLAIRR